VELHYDVARFLAAPDNTPFYEFVLSKPQKCRFFLDKEQIGIIERSLNTYGRGAVGMARILARVHVKTLLRRTSLAP
ncbi:MAG: hypothetical protein ACYS0C_08800, partial [Planctomycetota bacterium]